MSSRLRITIRCSVRSDTPSPTPRSSALHRRHVGGHRRDRIPVERRARRRRPASTSRFSSTSRSRSRPASLAPRRLSTAPASDKARPARDSRAASPSDRRPCTTAERCSYQCVTSSRIAWRSGCGTSTPDVAIAGGEIDLVAAAAPATGSSAAPKSPSGRTRSPPRRARSPRRRRRSQRTASTDIAGTHRQRQRRRAAIRRRSPASSARSARGGSPSPPRPAPPRSARRRDRPRPSPSSRRCAFASASSTGSTAGPSSSMRFMV